MAGAARSGRSSPSLGCSGLPFSEARGGFGGGAVETMIVMEAFGRGLILEPYLATVILGGGLVNRAASTAQLETLIPVIVDGSMKLAFAHLERHSRYDLADVDNAGATGRRWLDPRRRQERGAARRLR